MHQKAVRKASHLEQLTATEWAELLNESLTDLGGGNAIFPGGAPVPDDRVLPRPETIVQ